MANNGFTRIVVSGSERSLTELQGQLAAGARGHLAFTLVAAAPELWARDDHMQEATMDGADGILVLRTCLAHDGDALPLCGSLARRYPSLEFRGYFECEGTWPDFTVSSHSNGKQAYLVNFDARFAAHLHGPRPGEARHCLVHYPRSPERDAAALDLGAAELRPFLDGPPVAGTWRRSDDGPSTACYLREQEDGTVTALVQDPFGGERHLLSGVDIHGGYLACETLDPERLHVLFPELSVELARRPETAGAERDPAPPGEAPGNADDVPF